MVFVRTKVYLTCCNDSLVITTKPKVSRVYRFRVAAMLVIHFPPKCYSNCILAATQTFRTFIKYH